MEEIFIKFVIIVIKFIILKRFIIYNVFVKKVGKKGNICPPDPTPSLPTCSFNTSLVADVPVYASARSKLRNLSENMLGDFPSATSH